MLIAALFTVGKTWKQPKRPLTEAWMRKMRYTYNGILLSQHPLLNQRAVSLPTHTMITTVLYILREINTT